MDNRRAIALSAVVVIVLGVIVVVTLRGFAARDAQPIVTPAQTAEAPVAESSAPASPVTAADEAPPPWARGPGGPAVDVPAAAPPAADDNPVRARQMHDLQQSMQGVLAVASARSTETSQHLRKALDTLEEMNDPAVTSQIDLKALRDNLEISIEMQAVARQMQDTMAEPAGPERQQRLDANMAELRRLQTSMHADVRAAGSSLPPMSPPTR
ncbi:MAG TPA: hypothetical protein VLZ76_06085 [Lysobacter sp.]|jgi:hypothetical protein|nr:hypothetical protein [Lysobacter sp.]